MSSQPLIVQKFGGTSVADVEKIRAAARKAIRAQRQGNRVVMVVSAMGKNTDRLLELAADVSPNPPAREMDMLLSYWGASERGFNGHVDSFELGSDQAD